MNIWPLQFRKIGENDLHFSDDSGSFFRSGDLFLDRYIHGALTHEDAEFLTYNGQAFETDGDFAFSGFASRWAKRINTPGDLSYFILVPTLRCNLMCDYCQVSRAAENASGFDWDRDTLEQVINLLDKQKANQVKVEFQGGEPLLRLDILDAIRTFCRSRFATAEFVVCTNLQTVSEEAWRFLEAPDTHVSTSFDGTSKFHLKQRTKTTTAQRQFEANLDVALNRLGADRVSALPTIDPSDCPDPAAVIHAFAARSLTSIYLRRINYQGFARKKYGFDSSLVDWRQYYRRFIAALIEYNVTADVPIEEYYLTHILRRILQSGHNNHVDLRNPNWLGKDLLVIDFDGQLYPTDEARMVSRIGKIDLSIGSLEDGIDASKVAALNSNVSNFDDPDCVHCVYKAYCGLDPIDDLSRYGRVDLPRHQTDHCKSHLDLFDYAFSLLYSADPKVQKSLAIWLGVPKYNPKIAPRTL
jgi:His-Xaa-Ser system radical SAM maturase HxsB